MATGRISASVLLTCIAGLAAGGSANAAAKVAVKTEYYQISGKTGQALLDAMDRTGPKHGFLTRAIAQTRYSMHTTADWRQLNGVCRSHNVKVNLAITYVYPRPVAKFDARLARRWGHFMAGVVTHEKKHGQIAQEMAVAAARTISKMAVRDRPNCPNVQRLMKSKVNAVVAEYERRQERFDNQEHRNGGNIDRLVGGLLK
jgi:predicted secreted Zn-dependent protease